MAASLKTLDCLIQEFKRLPGVGAKTAERLAYHVLRSPDSEALRLAAAIREVKEKVGHCPVCYHLSDGGLCSICADPKRNHGQIMVVEQPKDVIAFERTGAYHGVYHVLQGRLAPMDGMEAEDLTSDALKKRVEAGGIIEVIIATNPDLEGDGTALALSNMLKSSRVKVMRIARGIPSGSAIEFASGVILSDALEGRHELRGVEGG